MNQTEHEKKLDEIYEEAAKKITEALIPVIKGMYEAGASDEDIMDILHDLLPDCRSEAWGQVRSERAASVNNG